MFDYNDSFCGKYIHINHQIFITWKKIKKGDVSLRGYNILIANQKKKISRSFMEHAFYGFLSDMKVIIIISFLISKQFLQPDIFK